MAELAADPVTGGVDVLDALGAWPTTPSGADIGAEPSSPRGAAPGDTGSGAVAGGWVGGGESVARETYAGAVPVPYFQPSTSPSCTRALPAPIDEYVNPDEPAGARKYAQ
jgi:hypothetical protein